MAIGQDGQNSETSFGGRSPATSPHSPSLSSFSKTGTHRGSLKKILDKSVSHRFFFFLFSIYFNLITFLQIEKRLKRTNSVALEGDPNASGSPSLPADDFRRGGALRSTAGPRLGWKNGSPSPVHPSANTDSIKSIQE